VETTLVEKENSRLIGLYMSGDEGAIDRLFRKYQPKVYAYLLKATKSIVPGDESDVPATENATYPISGYSTVRVVFG